MIFLIMIQINQPKRIHPENETKKDVTKKKDKDHKDKDKDKNKKSK